MSTATNTDIHDRSLLQTNCRVLDHSIELSRIFESRAWLFVFTDFKEEIGGCLSVMLNLYKIEVSRMPGYYSSFINEKEFARKFAH